MGGGVIVEEQVFHGHYRVLLVRAGGKHLYSIDYYRKLDAKPDCHKTLSTEGSPASICYVQISKGCEAVIVEASGRIELVNLRLNVDASEDPASGDLGKAREYCLERVEKWLSKVEESAG